LPGIEGGSIIVYDTIAQACRLGKYSFVVQYAAGGDRTCAIRVIKNGAPAA
jgi:hypothetical protein